ncbi:ABC transporter ATP-binding protein [Flavobacterium sp. CYK-4]|uniref:ABC transporter ATP-binding protein n=1 Tax=Flavobacterium lotistagni TaxID=2709660 RepID=UPI00140E47D3|nr:ABC transporter ATP-binding protein [Flavobacterium lotistagni]NHM07257.1 ABC transporter ATP-binding protein [Flavobacterium lotistagni]
MENVVLKTENLSIGYMTSKSENCIASGINITLKKGELTALIGANGVGKSTLLRTLTQIQPPLSGAISLSGKPLQNFKPIELAQELSLVLTEKLPPSNLTVYELIALGRQPYTNWIGKLSATDKNKIDHAIALTQLENLLQKRHYEISDGQLQIALIARALAQDTELIILDEPTTHLDLKHKVSLFRLLKKLAASMQKCVLFSTHDIELALQLSDELIVMNGQKIIQGAARELISNGIFDTIFNDENVSFDAQKGKFIFRNL